jgi:hypothetical protein
MTQDDDVHVIRFENFRGVFERLAFGQARAARGYVDYIRAQSHRRQLEGCAGARARLDEEIHQCFSTQRRNLFHLTGADLFERVRRFENEINLVGRKLAQPDEILATPARCDHRLCAQATIPGSARAPHAGFGVPPKQSFLRTMPQKKSAKARTRALPDIVARQTVAIFIPCALTTRLPPFRPKRDALSRFPLSENSCPRSLREWVIRDDRDQSRPRAESSPAGQMT